MKRCLYLFLILLWGCNSYLDKPCTLPTFKEDIKHFTPEEQEKIKAVVGKYPLYFVAKTHTYGEILDMYDDLPKDEESDDRPSQDKPAESNIETLTMEEVSEKIEKGEKLIIPVNLLCKFREENTAKFKTLFDGKKVILKGNVKTVDLYNDGISKYPMIDFDCKCDVGLNMTNVPEYLNGKGVMHLKKGDEIIAVGIVHDLSFMGVDLWEARLYKDVKDDEEKPLSISNATLTPKEYRQKWEDYIELEVNNKTGTFLIKNKTPYKLDEVSIFFTMTKGSLEKNNYDGRVITEIAKNIPANTEYKGIMPNPDAEWELESRIGAISSKEMNFCYAEGNWPNSDDPYEGACEEN